jgi:hypothetical protein
MHNGHGVPMSMLFGGGALKWSMVVLWVMSCLIGLSLHLYLYVSCVPLISLSCPVVSSTCVICSLLLCCVLLYSYFCNSVLCHTYHEKFRSAIAYHSYPQRNRFSSVLIIPCRNTTYIIWGCPFDVEWFMITLAHLTRPMVLGTPLSKF